MIRSSLAIVLLALGIIGDAYAADTSEPKLQTLNQSSIKVVNECPQATFGESGDAPDLWFDLNYEDRDRRRCEVAVHQWLQRDTTFDISFDFRLTGDAVDAQWLSIFQIHSFPDANEEWRCPIMALEAVGNQLRMFNRWDPQPLSNTAVATCAHPESSISSNTLISSASFAIGEWHRFRIYGQLTLAANGWLKADLNGTRVGEYTGPTTFNDQRQPYFKLGIYKPTSWSLNRDYRVEYRNISLSTGSSL